MTVERRPASGAAIARTQPDRFDADFRLRFEHGIPKSPPLGMYEQFEGHLLTGVAGAGNDQSNPPLGVAQFGALERQQALARSALTPIASRVSRLLGPCRAISTRISARPLGRAVAITAA